MTFDDPNAYFREEQVQNAIFEKDRSRIRVANTSFARSPSIFNIQITNANTESSQLLPDKTRQFVIRVRNGRSGLKVAFNPGESGSNFISIPRGSSYREEYLDTTNLTIYFQTDQPNQTIELITWGE